MKKRHSLSIGSAIFLVVIVYFICRLLLLEDILPFSIDSVQASMNHWVKHWHIVAVGLLPVYVALVFFGATLCGIFFGCVAQRWISRFCNKNNI